MPKKTFTGIFFTIVARSTLSEKKHLDTLLRRSNYPQQCPPISSAEYEFAVKAFSLLRKLLVRNIVSLTERHPEPLRVFIPT